jgi:hypothetical protein
MFTKQDKLRAIEINIAKIVSLDIDLKEVEVIMNQNEADLLEIKEHVISRFGKVKLRIDNSISNDRILWSCPK